MMSTQTKISPANTFIVRQRFCPEIEEMQSVGFSVSYFRLTIVLIIPKTKRGIPNPEIVNTM
jgi:hypothetical protein